MISSEVSAVLLQAGGMAELRQELVVIVAADDVVRDRNANCRRGLDRSIGSSASASAGVRA